eukprot:SAG31_NODE_667_length_12948_cov_70.090746_9_plen_143_part_00
MAQGQRFRVPFSWITRLVQGAFTLVEGGHSVHTQLDRFGACQDIELSISTDEHPVNKMLEKIKAIADVLGMGYAVELQQPDELNEHNFSGGSNAILAEPENGLPEATQLKSISRRLAWSQNVEALERSTGIRPTYEPRTDRS